jgi:hypothetical protein
VPILLPRRKAQSVGKLESTERVMTLELLTKFFAWFTIINYALLLVSWFAMLGMRNFVMRIHSATMKDPQAELPRLYFQFFAFYKVLILTFGLVPYLVMRFVL